MVLNEVSRKYPLHKRCAHFCKMAPLWFPIFWSTNVCMWCPLVCWGLASITAQRVQFFSSARGADGYLSPSRTFAVWANYGKRWASEFNHKNCWCLTCKCIWCSFSRLSIKFPRSVLLRQHTKISVILYPLHGPLPCPYVFPTSH